MAHDTDTLSDATNSDQKLLSGDCGSPIACASSGEDVQSDNDLQPARATAAVQRAEPNLPADPSSSHSQQASFYPTTDLRRYSYLRPFPPIMSWSEQSAGERVLTCFTLPLLIPIGLTIPMVSNILGDEVPSSRQTASQVDECASVPVRPLHQTVIGSTTTPNWIQHIQVMLGPQIFALVFVSQAFASDLTSSAIISATLLALVVSTLVIRQPASRYTATNKLLISVLYDSKYDASCRGRGATPT